MQQQSQLAASIIIPVYNEAAIIEGSICSLLEFLTLRSLRCELLIVDNGSTDNTFKIVSFLAQKHPLIRPLQCNERGPGRAFVHGVAAATCEYIITLDADLSSDLNFIELSLSLLPHAEMIVGSKSLGSQNRSFIRILGSQLYLACAQLVMGLPITDYSIGVKAFRRAAILPALSFLDPWTGHMLELSVYLRKRNKRIIQIGVDCDDTRRSKFNLWHEGFYRYRHIYHVLRAARNRASWLNKLDPEG